MEQRDQHILFELGPDILRELNIEAIQPYLSKYGLTATDELDTLLNDSITSTTKKKKLIYSWLPNKGDDSLSKFIEALRESSEGTTHLDLAKRLQAKRIDCSGYDECALDSGVDAASSTVLTGSHAMLTSSQDLSSSSVCSSSQEGNLSPTSDDIFLTEQYESVSSDSDAEEDSLRDTLQKKYTRVMGPSGVAKIANKISIEEFRLFCFNITRTPEDYNRMSDESLRSPEIWHRVSMNCNYCHFSPLESICRQFSYGSQEFLKLVEEYKEMLKDRSFKMICSNTKPKRGYQSVCEAKELFGKCVVSIAIALHERVVKKKVCLDDMKSYFCTLTISSIDHEKELLITNTNIQDNINKAKDVFFLLFAISPCWDCINFLFLEEHVVKQFGGDDEKRELESYKCHLKDQWLVRPVQEYPDMTAELTCFRCQHQIKCRINAEWDTTKINQVLKLRKVIASVYNVDVSAVKLLKASRGSVIVYFALPSVCNKKLPDEHILLLAKHDFLELTVYDLDTPDKDKVAIINYDIIERFAILDNLFQDSVVQSDDIQLRSEVSLLEKLTKHTNPPMQPVRKAFKHWTKHYIVLQIFATSGTLDIYHNESSFTHRKSPINSRTINGLDTSIQMKSEKRKPHILVVTNQNFSLSMSFSKQAEAEQWFIALLHVIGCFHVHLKIHPPHCHIPQDLVAKLKGNSMIFWSVLDQRKCMDWPLHDIIAVSLNKALYVRVKSASNAALKEDLFVFEGQQLKKLYDLLEEQLSSLIKHESCISAALDTQEIQESVPTYSSCQGTIEKTKHEWSTDTLTSEESGSTESTDNLFANDYHKYDILREIFSTESVTATYNAFSWRVIDEVRLQDKIIQLVKASWYSVISKYILNKGYRIIVILPDQQTKILAQERNDSEGKRQIQNRWKVVQALQETHIVLNKPSCIQEIGHFQAEMMIVESSEVPLHDLSLCHFQNVYYGSVKRLHPTIASPKDGLQTGMAQCTIPLAQLAEIHSFLSGKKFWLKLWPSFTVSQTSVSVNYQNKIEQHKFKELLNVSLLPKQYASQFTNSEILLYVPCSLQPFEQTLIQASQLAVDIAFSGKVVVFDWSIENHMDCIYHVMDEAKPRLLEFLKMLCSHSTKVHVVAVSDGALLLVRSLMRFDCKLGQVILTKLHRLSKQIFSGLEYMKQKGNSQAENITIYHKPKPLHKSLSLTQSLSMSRNRDLQIFLKKFLLEPPPFIPNVDIICLESNPDHYPIKNRSYASSKMVIEDMSEIICLGKNIVDRSSRVKLQCSCNELKRPIYRSNLPCMVCSCCSNFVMGYVEGLGNFTPTVLEFLHEGCYTDTIEKFSSIHKEMKLEGMLMHQCQNKKITKSAPQ